MDLTFSKNTVQIFSQWFGRNGAVVSPVREQIRRPPYPCTKINALPGCTPEEQGIESEYILKYYNRLCREPRIKMQTVIIARNGHIISRAHFYPYSTDIWHVSHSLAKSLTGLAVGLMVDDGLISLDDRLIDFFGDELPAVARINHKNTTIKHLLTMRTGVFFNEIGAVVEQDWVRAYLESGVKFKPGTQFEYNSMNSYMLSAIVKKVSGKGILELLRERVFTPLGIENVYWEKCPKGIEKGGWGVYYYPDEMLKLGQLYLNGGVWNGERIISERWIKESTRKQTDTPAETGENSYGYQVWCREDRSEFIFNGMFGQNIIVYPKTNIMIATTASIDETFQNSPLYTITDRYFGGAYRPHGHLEENREACGKLRAAEKTLVMHNSDAYLHKNDTDCFSLYGLSGVYTVNENDGAGLSIMPELYQGVHNCFAEGLREFELTLDKNGGTIKTLEGNTTHKLSFGYGKAVPGCVVYDKETILTSAYAVVIDEDGVKKLRITVCFPELPNIRYLTIGASEDGISVKWEEAPGYDFIRIMIDRTVFGKILIDRHTKAADTDFVLKRIRYFLQPTVNMKRKDKNK